MSQTLPSNLTPWNQLSILSLSNTSLQGDLTGICQLTSILELDPGQNTLYGIIPDCITLTIENLGLYSNLLTGSIPVTISQMIFLQELTLFDNHLTGDVSEMHLDYL